MSTSERFHHLYWTPNGKIEPWGTIANTFPVDVGHRIWSEQLLPYGNANATSHIFRECFKSMIFWRWGREKKPAKYCARIGEEEIEVVTQWPSEEKGRVVARISCADCMILEKEELYVTSDGYLVDGPEDFWAKKLKALRQNGGRVAYDNSSFVQINRKYARKKVIELKWKTFKGRMTDHAMVFTKEGERVPFEICYPFSFAR